MAKARNVSIRFDEEKLEFFRSRNPNIQKQQKIVDYFLDKYWWEHHIDNPAPVMSLSEVVEKYSPEAIKVDVTPKSSKTYIAKVKDLNKPKSQVKEVKAAESNSVINTMLERLPGEKSIDYQLRCLEFKNNPPSPTP